MDTSRLKQMDMFYSVANDSTETPFRRRQAAHALAKVHKQLKDPTLIKIRHRYFMADANGDEYSAQFISNELDRYMIKTYGKRI